MTTALVMAGGRGTRMTGSGVAIPKPLVPIAGTPLLEHNVRQLLAAGSERIHVAVAEPDHQVRAFVAEVLAPLGREGGVEVTEIPEPVPLGNIGAARRVPGPPDALLVVYADNVTTLDLRAIVEHHGRSGADLTLAAHLEPFTMPFGELVVADDDPTRIVTYREKPRQEYLVSSAVMVLGPTAVRLLPADRPTGISELANRVLGADGVVRSWSHDDPWVDVNDAAAVIRAEQVLREHPHAFALPTSGPGTRR